jgi:hypothetical protein
MMYKLKIHVQSGLYVSDEVFEDGYVVEF